MKQYLIILLLTSLSLLSYAQQDVQSVSDFTITDIDGETYHLYDYLENDTYVLLNFFGVTCNTCIDFVPDLNKLYTIFGCNDYDLLILSVEQTHLDEEVQEFQSLYNTKYPLVSGLEGGGSALFADWNISYTPQVFLIAPDKEIAETYAIHEFAVIESSLLSYGIEHYPCNVTITEEQKAHSSLTIYPNPSRGDVAITLGKKWANARLTITSIDGATILIEKRIQQNDITINGLENGFYFVTLRKAHHTITKQFIVY